MYPSILTTRVTQATRATQTTQTFQTTKTIWATRTNPSNLVTSKVPVLLPELVSKSILTLQSDNSNSNQNNVSIAKPSILNTVNDKSDNWRIIAPPKKDQTKVSKEEGSKIVSYTDVSELNDKNNIYRSPFPPLSTNVIWNNQYDDNPTYPLSPFINSEEKFCNCYPFYDKRNNWLFTGCHKHKCTGGINCESWLNNGYEVPINDNKIQNDTDLKQMEKTSKLIEFGSNLLPKATPLQIPKESEGIPGEQHIEVEISAPLEYPYTGLIKIIQVPENKTNLTLFETCFTKVGEIEANDLICINNL